MPGLRPIREQVGPLAGVDRLPQLRDARPRLGELATACDPLRLQADLARAMITADAPLLGLYFVDDHFVPYEGAKPVGKGWNTKRRHAQKGLADTVVTDYHGRAVCFVSGPPSGLTKTLPAALAELRTVTGQAKIMLGFDRGGSYAQVFDHCRGSRRGSGSPPPRRWVGRQHRDATTVLAGRRRRSRRDRDPGRRDGADQGLRSGAAADLVRARPTGAAGTDQLPHRRRWHLLAWLRCRWRIENVFKYLSAHHGIDWLCHYGADIGPGHRADRLPARKTARVTAKRAELDLAGAQRAFAELLHAELPVTR